MTFTYTRPTITGYNNLDFCIWKVRLISRDTRDNPPFSLSDEEWTEYLFDTNLRQSDGSYIYQVYKAVHRAISTNPDRLKSLTEASGNYQFVDLETTKRELLEAQRELNLSLGIFQNSTQVTKGNFLTSIPVIRGW